MNRSLFYVALCILFQIQTESLSHSNGWKTSIYIYNIHKNKHIYYKLTHQHHAWHVSVTGKVLSIAHLTFRKSKGTNLIFTVRKIFHILFCTEIKSSNNKVVAILFVDKFTMIVTFITVKKNVTIRIYFEIK